MFPLANFAWGWFISSPIRCLAMDYVKEGKTVIRASKTALAKAHSCGQHMGRRQLSLRPDFSDALEYPSYSFFAAAQRYKLEHHPHFSAWDALLQNLVDREADAATVDFDDPKYWDILYTSLGNALRDAFWNGWEKGIDLPKLYQDYTQSARQRQAEQEAQLNAGRSMRSLLQYSLNDWDESTDQLIDQAIADNAIMPPKPTTDAGPVS
jgi:hypothetical protein